jgi:hypothetical protein
LYDDCIAWYKHVANIDVDASAATTKANSQTHLTTKGNSKFADYPIVEFLDASFQDCPDSGRSTGRLLIFMQGGVVYATSTMP